MLVQGQLDYFRKVIGQAFSGRKFDDSIYVLYAPSADNGKSAVRLLCEAVFGLAENGGYFMGPDYTLLTEKRKSGVPSNALMGTRIARVLFINEIQPGVLNPMTFNTLGSADTIVSLHKKPSRI